MPKETLKYTNEKITVVWKPKLCIHSTNCFKGLPEVFNPKARPWIDMAGADAERIIAQVHKCPSGALSIDKGEEPTPLHTNTEETDLQIQVQANGPLLVKGTCIIKLSCINHTLLLANENKISEYSNFFINSNYFCI